jgi:hypothetical protein
MVAPPSFLPALPALVLFAAQGLNTLFARLGCLPALLLAARLGLFILGDIAGPFLVPRHVEFRMAGLALSGLRPKSAHMLARKWQAPFYAGVFWEWLPYGDLDAVLANARAHNAVYLVVDEATTPNLRPKLAFLLDPAAAPPSLTPLYVSHSGLPVIIYLITN